MFIGSVIRQVSKEKREVEAGVSLLARCCVGVSCERTVTEEGKRNGETKRRKE